MRSLFLWLALGASIALSPSAFAQTPEEHASATTLRRYLVEWSALLKLKTNLLTEIERARIDAWLAQVEFVAVQQEGVVIRCLEDFQEEPGGGRLYFEGPFCFQRAYDRVRIGTRALDELEQNPREARTLAGWILLRMNGRFWLRGADVRGLVDELWGDYAHEVSPVSREDAERASLVNHEGRRTPSREELLRQVAGHGETVGPSLGAYFTPPQRAALNTTVVPRLRATVRAGVGLSGSYRGRGEAGTQVPVTPGVTASALAHGVASLQLSRRGVFEMNLASDFRAAVQSNPDLPVYQVRFNLGSALLPFGLMGLWVAVDANQWSDIREQVTRLGLNIVSYPLSLSNGNYLYIQIAGGPGRLEARGAGLSEAGGEVSRRRSAGGALSAILRHGKYLMLVRGQFDRVSSSYAETNEEGMFTRIRYARLDRFGVSAALSVPLGALLRNDAVRIEADLVHYIGATREMLETLPEGTQVRVTRGTLRLLYDLAF
jgi:hypothetical protein